MKGDANELSAFRNFDELFKNLKDVYTKLENENDRHSVLIKSQLSLQLINIIRYFDNNQDLILNKKEIKHAKKTLLNVLPNIKWEDIKDKIKNNESKLESMIELVNSSNFSKVLIKGDKK